MEYLYEVWKNEIECGTKNIIFEDFLWKRDYRSVYLNTTIEL